MPKQDHDAVALIADGGSGGARHEGELKGDVGGRQEKSRPGQVFMKPHIPPHRQALTRTPV
jgi:hypothetical protein